MKSFIKTVVGTLSLGLVGLAVAGPVAAHDDRGKHGDRAAAQFERLDADADGYVTADEMDGMRLARFTEHDTDGDGFLSLEEMQAAAMQRYEGRDRQPDAAEFADRSRRMLRFMDENGDGKVAFDEMPDYRGNRMMDRLDADADGRISKAEFEEGRGKMRMGRMGHKGKHHE